MKFSSLPSPLLFLFFTWPVFATPTSHNDPFRTIALKQPKPEKDPICCLTPLPPIEPQPTEDELLMSFEDWKAKLLAEERSNPATGSSANADSPRHMSRTDLAQAADGSGNGGSEGGGAEGQEDRTDPSPNIPVSSASGQTLPQDQLDFGSGEPMLPHFRVPLTDRFNYASMECSARVHKAHKSAKSAASILSSKKDRYMLSPCATKSADGKEENHFVVVELCEDIRIDTVQLANFEFFSGVFKDFTVSVAKTYTPDLPEWTTVGTYKARNIRGVQSFHPPTSFRDFYRYIRIDFHSHYGSEFYCPVSLLRVYGLTHLEEWKWDDRANRYEQLQVPTHTLPPKTAVEPVSSTPADTASETSTTQALDLSTESSSEAGRVRTKTDTQPSGDAVSPVPEPTPTPQELGSDESSSPPIDAEPSVTATNPPQSSSSVISDSTSSLSQSASVPTPQTTEVISNVVVRSPSPPPPSQATPVISLGSQASIPPPQVGTGGGESIYRTIMKKIAKLELNATLHARYVEEHTIGVREVLKRLTEEVGRLEGIGKAQAQTYQRSLLDMERHRRRLELEHVELMSRVQYLAEEITMEKRLGIAQLCIMVAVLVFMALTRGSRGDGMDHTLLPRLSRQNRMASLSGEWMDMIRNGSSPTPLTRSPDGGIVKKKTALDDEKVEFPSNVIATLDRLERIQHKNQATSSSLRKSGSRARTPQTRAPRTVRLSTPTPPSFRPSIVRANSQGNDGMSQSLSSNVIVPLPKSAKRWARTAHVHEIKRKSLDSGVSSQSEAEIETPNDPSSRIGWLNKGKQKETDAMSHTPFIPSRRGSIGRSPLRPTTLANVSMLDAEVTDSWVDTDDASSSEADVYLNRTKERFAKSTDTLTIHRHRSQGLVGVGAS